MQSLNKSHRIGESDLRKLLRFKLLSFRDRGLTHRPNKFDVPQAQEQMMSNSKPSQRGCFRQTLAAVEAAFASKEAVSAAQVPVVAVHSLRMAKHPERLGLRMRAF